MPHKGILFDLDDTIIAFGSVADAAWIEICNIYYEDCTCSSANELFQAILKTSKWHWSDKDRHKIGRYRLDKTRREIVHLALLKIGINNSSLAHTIADSFIKRRKEMIQPFPQAIETLEHLNNKNISLALITNGESEKQRNKIKRFHLERFFDTILIEGEIGYGKPDQQVYTMALNGLKLSPEEV